MNPKNPLASGRVLIIDGGTGSELRRRGVSLSPTVWSAAANRAHDGLLAEIHADYIRAGADVVTANTFATTRFALRAAGLDDRFEEINERAVAAAVVARETVGRDVTVAASMSCLPPGFDPRAYPDPEEELAAYRELAALFARRGVDLLLLEMMQDDTHARRACEAAAESGLPFWLGLSCRVAAEEAGVDRGAESARTRSDDSAGRAVREARPRNEPPALRGFDRADVDFDATLDALLPFAPAVVAVMHSPVDAIVPALARIRSRWTGALGAYAEIAYPEDPSAGAAAERLSPATYAAEAGRWLDAGASVLGGCCGTTPDHIRALADLVAARGNSERGAR